MNEQEWKKISKAFFSKPKVNPSEDFVEKVMSRLEQPARSPVRLAWPRWIAPAAALAGLSIFLFSGNLSKETQPTTESYLNTCVDERDTAQVTACDEEPQLEELVGLNWETL